MCQAINDLMRDEFQNGKTAGLREGRSEGLREGELNGIQLAKKVFFLWFSGVAPADIAQRGKRDALKFSSYDCTFQEKNFSPLSVINRQRGVTG